MARCGCCREAWPSPVSARGSRPRRRAMRSSCCSSSSRGSASPAYHPEGAKFAAYASGRKRASGMSYFNIGGNTGYALGPIVVTPLVIWLGLEGGLIAMLPVLVVAGHPLPRAAGAQARGPRAFVAPGEPRRRRRPGDVAARHRDRLPERRVVRPSHLRPAVGRRERRNGGRGEPHARADARRGGGRHARARPRRRPARAAPDTPGDPGCASGPRSSCS